MHETHTTNLPNLNQDNSINLSRNTEIYIILNFLLQSFKI